MAMGTCMSCKRSSNENACACGGVMISDEDFSELNWVAGIKEQRRKQYYEESEELREMKQRFMEQWKKDVKAYAKIRTDK
jgi:hypothetical protein